MHSKYKVLPWARFSSCPQHGQEELHTPSQEATEESSGFKLSMKPEKVELDEVVCLDTETTGRSKTSRVIEIAAVRVSLRRGRILAQASQLLNPGVPVPPEASAINHITTEMLIGKPTAEKVLPGVFRFIGGLPLVAHKASFDASMLAGEMERYGLPRQGLLVYDSLSIATKVLSKKETPNHKLATLIRVLGVPGSNAHRALADALALAHVLLALLARSPKKSLVELSSPPLQL